MALSSSNSLALSIVIANYNGCSVLARCLQSILDNPPGRPFEIIVVDDASSDGSAPMVRERFPTVHLVRNDANLHYGRSTNVALALARGRYVYLLNNDTVVLPQAIDALMSFLDGEPVAGAVASKLLNPDGTIQPSVKVLPSLMSALFGARSIIARLFPGNRFTRGQLLHLSRDMTRPFTAGYVSGASFMLRREALGTVGPLDERFFYFTDADYCKRLWDAGWCVYYLPASAVIHFAHTGGSMVTLVRRIRSLVEWHRGAYLYFRKHPTRSTWHPKTLIAALALCVRFLMAFVLQLASEIGAALSSVAGPPAAPRQRGGRQGERPCPRESATVVEP